MQEAIVTTMSTHRIIVATDWSSRLHALGEIVEATEDIRQCIAIILGTVKGSVPHRVDFGCELWRYIDLPPQIAVPYITYEATSAIERWEPRAVLDDVSVVALEPHHYQLRVSWHPKDSESTPVVQEVTI